MGRDDLDVRPARPEVVRKRVQGFLRVVETPARRPPNGMNSVKSSACLVSSAYRRMSPRMNAAAASRQRSTSSSAAPLEPESGMRQTIRRPAGLGSFPT
jgi:hypothetical protein